jgi:hypothetical protein
MLGIGEGFFQEKKVEGVLTHPTSLRSSALSLRVPRKEGFRTGIFTLFTPQAKRGSPAKRSGVSPHSVTTLVKKCEIYFLLAIIK